MAFINPAHTSTVFLFINPASICTGLVSSIQRLFQ